MDAKVINPTYSLTQNARELTCQVWDHGGQYHSYEDIPGQEQFPQNTSFIDNHNTKLQ